MALYTGCILLPKKNGRMRYSVMRCHTLEDGKTPDTRIVKGANYDDHLFFFGAPLWLLGDYYKRGLPFEIFEARYLEYLKADETCNAEIPVLLSYALKSDVELCCIERWPHKCHRRVLAEHIRREHVEGKPVYTGLKIIIE